MITVMPGHLSLGVGFEDPSLLFHGCKVKTKFGKTLETRNSQASLIMQFVYYTMGPGQRVDWEMKSRSCSTAPDVGLQGYV